MPFDAVDLVLMVSVVVSALLLLWPFLFYPMILRFLPQRPLALVANTQAPSVSILFCAFNEAGALPARLQNLHALKQRHPQVEILAYDDGSSDATGDILAAAGDLLIVERGPGRLGKAHGMKRLAMKAGGDVLVLTDANVLFAEDALEKLLAPYADPQVGGVLGSLRYMGTDRSASAGVGGLYWRIEEALKDRESSTGNVMGADGSIFSVRTALYPDFPDDVLDDLTVSMAVVFAGLRLVKAPDAIAYEAMVAARGDEYARKRRIAARAWHTHRHLLPELRRMTGLDRFKYASRKLVRWFGAVWIALGAFALLMLVSRHSPFAAIALLAGGLMLFLVGIQMRRGPLAALVDLLLAYVATFSGIVQAMRGRSPTIWAPAKSRNLVE